MKILHKNADGKWEQIQSAPYSNEAELQDLIADDAGILPFDDIGYEDPFVTIGKEVGLHGNSLDLLAISPKGHVAVIETKLTRNPEIRREVVGQVLSYAASLWKMTYSDLENYFHRYLLSRKLSFDGTLYEYMKSKCSEADINEEEFRTGLEKRLELGSFSLLIVVDALGDTNKELIDIANYLNDRTGQEIDFYVVEIERIGDHAGSYLLPRLANPPHKNISATSVSTRTDKYDRKPINREVLLSRLDDNEKKIAEMLLNAASLENKIGITWRKTGFSIWTMIPREFSHGVWNYESGYSYLFFKASPTKDQMTKTLSFWYPENTYDSLPLIRPLVEDYRKKYMSNPSYDSSSKETSLEKIALDYTEELIEEMIRCAKRLAAADKDRKYDSVY